MIELLAAVGLFVLLRFVVNIPSLLGRDILALCAASTPLLFGFLLEELKNEFKRRKLLEKLPAELIKFSTFPPDTPVTEILASSDHSLFKGLGGDFLSSIEEKMRRCEPGYAKKVLQLIKDVYLVGGDFSKAFKGVADDLRIFFSVKREIETALLIQKYSLIISTVFLMPACLGMVTSIARSLFPESEILSLAIQTNVVYVPLSTTIVFTYFGLIEGNLKKAALQILLSIPVAIGIYSVIGAMELIS